jgi:hypothetical protein
MEYPPAKRSKGNPPGQDCFLLWNNNVIRDEDKIIAVQRRFKDEYYKPGGRWFTLRVRKHGDSVLISAR